MASSNQMEEETAAHEPTDVNRGVVKEETVRVEITYVTDNLGRPIVCRARGEARCAWVDDEGGDKGLWSMPRKLWWGNPTMKVRFKDLW
ncbi:hypothetical protein ACFX13_044376 [Malus domestica]